MSDHTAHEATEDAPQIDEACGYTAGSFACRVRHIQINTGDAKAANDVD